MEDSNKTAGKASTHISNEAGEAILTLQEDDFFSPDPSTPEELVRTAKAWGENLKAHIDQMRKYEVLYPGIQKSLDGHVQMIEQATADVINGIVRTMDGLGVKVTAP